LDNTDSVSLTIALLDALAALAKWKPKLFEDNFQVNLLRSLRGKCIYMKSFQDVVDLLIGLYLDPSQTPTLRKRISEVRVIFGHDLLF